MLLFLNGLLLRPFYYDKDEGGGGGDSGQDSDTDTTLDDDKDKQDLDESKAKGKDTSDLNARELKRARDEAAKYRLERKKAASDLDALKQILNKALGMEADDATPENLTKELSATKQRLRDVQVSNAFQKVAGQLEADPELTLYYMQGKGMLKDIDPDDEDFEEDLKRQVKLALKQNTKLRHTPATGKSGAEFNKDGTNKKDPDVNAILRAAMGYQSRD
jgi:hypothetical protein